MPHQITLRWNLPTPNPLYPLNGQRVRAYLNGTKFLDDNTLNTEHTILRFPCEDGELTTKTSSLCEADESEPDSETIAVGECSETGFECAADGSINPNIPKPTGSTLTVDEEET